MPPWSAFSRDPDVRILRLERRLREKSSELEKAKNARAADNQRSKTTLAVELARRDAQHQKRENDIRQALEDQTDAEKREFGWKCQQAIEGLKQQHAQRAAEHDERVMEMVRMHSEEVTGLNERINSSAEMHARELWDRDMHCHRLIYEHEQALESRDNDRQRLIEDHSRELQRLAHEKKEHDNQWSDRLKSMMASNEEQLEKLKEDHRQEMQGTLKQHHQEKEQHRQEMESTRKHLNESNAALLKRDDSMFEGELPRLADGKLKQNWTQLVAIVDGLGRIPWKQNTETWTELVVAVGENQGSQRLLKKAIVQDIIWTVLVRRIFCSPFRILGPEGSKLEDEWNQKCGKSVVRENGRLYSWPPRGPKNERWRYLTIKECWDVLNKPPAPSAVDARARVMEGATQGLNDLIEELQGALKEVVDLGAEEAQQVEKLCIGASNLWMEFAMHRCRLQVRLKAPETMRTADRAASAAHGRPMTLTVKPEVGRYGNVNGLELETYTIIGGCEGEGLGIP